MNSLFWRVMAESMPPLPITKTLRTVLEVDQVPDVVFHKYGYFFSVWTAVVRVLGPLPAFVPSPSMLDWPIMMKTWTGLSPAAHAGGVIGGTIGIGIGGAGGTGGGGGGGGRGPGGGLGCGAGGAGGVGVHVPKTAVAVARGWVFISPFVL